MLLCGSLFERYEFDDEFSLTLRVGRMHELNAGFHGVGDLCDGEGIAFGDFSF